VRSHIFNPVTQGRALTMETDERTSSIGPGGIMAMACGQRRPDATREAPAVIVMNKDRRVAERLVVLMKPSNVGGGKGPQLKTDAKSNEGHGD
jgi:hypothetical protein